MVDAIPRADASPLFADDEKAAIALALELTKTATLSDVTFQRAREHFDERQLVEMVLNVGIANLSNRFSDAFRAGREA